MGTDWVERLEAAAGLHAAPPWVKLLRAPRRLALIRWAAWIGRRGGAPVGVRARVFWGDPLQVMLPDSVSAMLYGYGHYEPELTGFLLRFLKPGSVAVDVGADVGCYSLLMSRLLGAEGTIHSFEPTPRTFELLSTNLRSRGNVHLDQAAVWRENTTLGSRDFGSGLATFDSVTGGRSENDSAAACPTTFNVRAIALDRYLQAFGGRAARRRLAGGRQSRRGRRGSDEEDSRRSDRQRLRRFRSRSRGTDPASPARRWFRRGVPLPCQAGTPILAFARAFDSAFENQVLPADCDMLFVEAGWLDTATKMFGSGAADLVEPPRLEEAERCEQVEISTRALMNDRRAFGARCLPISVHRLDPLLRLHRRLAGRPTWLALEQILQREKQRGHLRHVVLESSLGYSMHVATRDDVRVEGFPEIVAGFEHGLMPAAQSRQWNFLPAAWAKS